MSKKNISIIILLLCATGGSTVFFLSSYTSLRVTLITNQTAAERQIEALKEEIEALKTANEDFEVKAKDEAVEEKTQAPSEIITPQSPPSSTSETEPPISEAKSTGPTLTATPEVFDLGTISKKNGIATANFELKNTGNSDLTISYAFTSCGCTVAPIKEEKILKPTEIYTMAITYDPNFYGPTYELGAIEKTVTIISNDTAKSFYKVKLKANVIP